MKNKVSEAEATIIASRQEGANIKKVRLTKKKKELADGIIARTMDKVIGNSGDRTSAINSIVGMQTLLPEEVREYAAVQADKIMKESGFDLEQLSKSESGIFKKGANPVKDMMYMFYQGMNVKKFCKTPLKYMSNDDIYSFANDYFVWCASNKVKTSIPGFATWIGVSTRQLVKINEGSEQCNCGDAISYIFTAMQTLDDNLAVTNKTDRVVHVFNSKNFYGMSDKKESTITYEHEDKDNRKKIIDALPIH